MFSHEASFGRFEVVGLVVIAVLSLGACERTPVAAAPKCGLPEGEQLVIQLLQENDADLKKEDGDPRYAVNSFKFSGMRPSERRNDLELVECHAEVELTLTRSPKLQDPIAGTTWSDPVTKTWKWKNLSYSLQYAEDGSLYGAIRPIDILSGSN